MTGVVLVSSAGGCRGRRGEEEEGKRAKEKEEERRKQQQISVLALLLAAIRRSMVSSCRMERDADDEVIPALQHMEIGWPTDVRHVAHVTFDRFNGFLGLPVEFELEVPGRVPSARSTFFLLSLPPSVSSLMLSWEINRFDFALVLASICQKQVKN